MFLTADIFCQINATPVSSRTVSVSTDSSAFLCFSVPASAVATCLHACCMLLFLVQMAAEKTVHHHRVGTAWLPHPSIEGQPVFALLVSLRLLCDERLEGEEPLILT